MKTLEITKEATEHEKQFCKDPSFYVWGDEHQHTATITVGDRTIKVFCDGEMRLNLWDSAEACQRRDEPQVIRYCDRLVSAGITTDKELSDAFDAGRIEWVNNAWFDLYAYGDDIEDGWLDCVHHDLDEAILQAAELIENNEFWKEVK